MFTQYFDETAMDERERSGRHRVPYDLATPEESAVIHHALKAVLMGIGQARRIIFGVRVSNETQDALELPERAERELDSFIRRED
jgi:hypothetical protein